MVLALAWKFRCAVIRLINCSVRSTLESSREPELINPALPSPGALIIPCPDEKDSPQ